MNITRGPWVSCGVIVSMSFVVAAVSLGITSWSVRGSDDFRYLGSALGVMTDFAHWEMRWPFNNLQAVGLKVFGPDPNGIWASRWLTWGCVLSSIGFLGHVAYGRLAAVWSILLLGFCPLLVTPVSQGWIDSMEAGWVSMLAAMLILLLRHKHPDRQFWLAAVLGVALGLAMLTRITAILVLPTAMLVWWWIGRPWRPMAAAALGMLVVLAIDAAYLYNLFGDGLARWRHLGTLGGGGNGISGAERFSPPTLVRLTYGLPRVLLLENPIVSAWPTWLLGCASLIALGFFKSWRLSRRRVGLLLLTALIGVLVLLLLPKPGGSFALRLLPRYFTFVVPLLGVAAVVCVLILAKKYPLAKPVGLLALLGAGAFYTGLFLIPERYYSTPLREGMSHALHLARHARPGDVVVTDDRTARLLSRIGELHGWPQLVWMDYERWTDAPTAVDAFILLDVPHGHNADADRVRAWLTEHGSYALVSANDYSECSKLRLWSCVPDRVAVAAIRKSELNSLPYATFARSSDPR